MKFEGFRYGKLADAVSHAQLRRYIEANESAGVSMRARSCMRTCLLLFVLSVDINSVCRAAGYDRNESDLRRERQILTTYATNPILQDDCGIAATLVRSNASLAGRATSHSAGQFALSVNGFTHVDKPIGLAEAIPSALSNRDARFRQKADDATITASIRSKLLWRAATSGLDIRVLTRDGLARVDGSVYKAEQRDIVIRVVADTAGVRLVDDEIVVFNQPPITDMAKSAQVAISTLSNLPVSDTWIVSHIESAFALSPSVNHADIRVSARDGAVSLDGRAGPCKGRESAIEIAEHMRGVRSVNADRLADE